MSQRVSNFSAGPATLPYDVLTKTAEDIVNFKESGIGLMEISHRSSEFQGVIDEAERLLRELMGIPENYKVLFLQGGASSQFFMIPMNMLSGGKKATYLNTGTWAKKAIAEARLFGDIEVPYSSEKENYNRVPDQHEYTIADDSEYLYLVSNNTIFGTQFQQFPDTGKMLISDMSSDILSRPVDVSRFGLIFAGAQKNLGPAGVTVVIVREDLLSRCPDTTPTMLKYRTHADKGSMFNTPPCLAIYVVYRVLQWLNGLGGVEAIQKINRQKAATLYEIMDSGDYYRGHADPQSRSQMNVAFNLPTPELEAKFIADAAAQGFKGLKGHRSIGGCRASIYNAFSLEGVTELAAFMERFANENPA
ncbi:MAG: 3-phosphoserine/phosphohydroxythreonine transaminase [Desulfofustis sp.]|nr:3-phosphoserine/phosphohydroxythreonine transaminase [Desulfofustis sp.]